MRKNAAAVGATIAASAIMLTGLAAPAAAQEQWLMPDVRGEVLQSALNDVHGVTGDAELNITYFTVNVRQDVYNLTNWAVCATSPVRGKEISQKTKKVVFAVRRLNEKCS